ncbi:hypothetical protein QBC98_002907 [Kitasatospora acidiphila]
MFNAPRSTVYGHLDREKTVPPPAEEDRRGKALKANDGLLAPWCPSWDYGAGSSVTQLTG